MQNRPRARHDACALAAAAMALSLGIDLGRAGMAVRPPKGGNMAKEETRNSPVRLASRGAGEGPGLPKCSSRWARPSGPSASARPTGPCSASFTAWECSVERLDRCRRLGAGYSLTAPTRGFDSERAGDRQRSGQPGVGIKLFGCRREGAGRGRHTADLIMQTGRSFLDMRRRWRVPLCGASRGYALVANQPKTNDILDAWTRGQGRVLTTTYWRPPFRWAGDSPYRLSPETKREVPTIARDYSPPTCRTAGRRRICVHAASSFAPTPRRCRSTRRRGNARETSPTSRWPGSSLTRQDIAFEARPIRAERRSTLARAGRRMRRPESSIARSAWVYEGRRGAQAGRTASRRDCPSRGRWSGRARAASASSRRHLSSIGVCRVGSSDEMCRAGGGSPTGSLPLGSYRDRKDG